MEEQRYLYKCPNHTTNLNNMRLNNKWCDVTIKVGDREICAHKVILAANLEYFENMFSNDSFQESRKGVVTMESVEGTNLELFISYAYTGEMLLTDSNALNLLGVANYFGEDGIKEACIDFLKKNLKAEEACRAYKFANTIDCLSLKNTAKATIVKNFGICTQITDYFNFEYEHLTDILSDGKAQPAKSQQRFFEGIMKWIMHEPKNRKIHMNDLLSYINIAKSRVDDLIDYLYENIVDCNDEYGIVKDVMFSYYTNKIEQKKHEHTLMIAGDINSKVHFQFYNFVERKWSPLQKIPDADGIIFTNGAVLNDKLYYVIDNLNRSDLQVFDPTTKSITTLDCSSSMSRCSICACNGLLYLCGGFMNNSSDQVLRYDSQTNSSETLAPMRTKRWGSVSIFYQGYLHIIGGVDGLAEVNTVEKYDPSINEWTSFPPMHLPRRSCGVAILDKKLYVFGGYTNNRRTNTVEVYDPSENSWRSLSSMKESRSTFVAVVHEGKLLVIGGNNENTVEVYDPDEDKWCADHELSSGLKLQHNRGGLILSSCITDSSS